MKPYCATLFTLCVTLVVSLPRAASQEQLWEAVNGPYQGAVIGLAVGANGEVFAASAGGGVFRTRDNGATWCECNSGLTDREIRCLAVGAAGHLYVGTTRGGVYRSANSGDTWSVGFQGLPQGVSVRSLSTGQGGEMFAGTFPDGKLYRLKPGGNAWSQCGEFKTGQHARDLIVAVVAGPNATIYAAHGRAGIWASTDNAATWQPLPRPAPGRNLNALAVSPQGALLAGTDDGLFLSVDGGRSWNRRDLGGRVTAITVDANTIYAGSVGSDFGNVYRSTDGGTTFVPLTKDRQMFATVGQLQMVGAIAHNGRALLVAGNGAFRSLDNGTTWQPANTGLKATRHIHDVLILPKGELYVASGIVHRSTNGGQTWTLVSQGLRPSPGIAKLGVNAQGEVLAGGTARPGNPAIAYHLTGNQDAWVAATGLSGTLAVGDFATNEAGDVFTCTGWAGDLWRSTDGGRSYSRTTTIRSAGFFVSKAPGGDLYYGREISPSVHRSTDGGKTWSELPPMLNGYGDAWAICFNRRGEPLVGHNHRGVFRFSGGVWTDCPGVMTSVNDFAVNSEGTIFAAGDQGVFVSTDEGSSWRPFGEPSALAGRVKSLAIDAEGRLYAGMKAGGGLYRTVRSTQRGR